MSGGRVRFGPWLFDGAARQLSSQGGALHLTPKAFQLLEALLEARPRALSKSEIRDRIWPGTHVTDSSLNRLVAELRQALGDEPRQVRYIRTVFGFGYAFSGPAAAEPSPAAAEPARAGWLLMGERSFELQPGDNVVGRSEECLVRLSSPRVSRRHALIRVSEGQATIEDLGSRNGTSLAGEPVRGPRPLSDGDEILVGGLALRFRSVRPSDPTLDGLE